MVPLTSLAVPIVLSAIIAFVTSFVFHMVLPFHRNDLRRLPQEDDVLNALRRFNIPPGDYGAPHAGSPEGMKKPEFIEKMKKGPVVLMTVSPGAAPSMGKSLALWFLYLIVVSVVAAYVTGRALGPGAHYRAVFRFAGCVAFTGYSLALLQNSIWYRRKWSTTLKSNIDSLIYGFLTGGMLGWLWPR